jgi:hypothetical protein
MQIAFVTLFLGLISGRQPVAFAVTGEVAAIELVLDGAVAGRLIAPPWRGRIDLGAGLLPHHLVARALDRQGVQMGTAEQWINLPRPPAEVEVIVEQASAGGPQHVRLAWQSVTNQPPEVTALTLDGESLVLDAQRRAVLPPAAAAGTRLLSAEMSFGGGVVARKDMALDREFGDEVATELTPVPVRLRTSVELPPAGQLQGWLEEDGRSLKVDAVETGRGRLIVVRDPSATRYFNWLDKLMSQSRVDSTLARGWEVQFLWPQPEVHPANPANRANLANPENGGRVSDLFQPSQVFDGADHGLLFWLARVVHERDRLGAGRLADAVAVAGLHAYAGGKPRAVLLVLGPRWSDGDASAYSGQAVRRYLAALQVPLFVWSTAPPRAAAQAAWGEIETLTGQISTEHAFRKLRDELDGQRILMVEGRHLPQSITVGAAAHAAIELRTEPAAAPAGLSLP